MNEVLQKMQQLQLKAAEKGESFMIISDGAFINASVILLDGRGHSFKIEEGYCNKTKNEILERINKII